MTLPTELEQQFRVELAQFEAEVKMEYITSVERLAMEEGRLAKDISVEEPEIEAIVRRIYQGTAVSP